MKPKVTIKDVAARSGFSVTTVSHVINKTRFVDKSTKNKVLDAISELGYRPNIIARSLKGKGTKTIGLIISDIREGFFSEIIKSIETKAFKEGYNVILCDSEEKVKEERFYIDVLLQKGIDGLILSPVDSNADFEDILVYHIPITQLDRKMNNLKTDFVGIDNEESSKKAVYHLLNEGYKKIGYIGFEERIYTMEKRRDGYVQALKEEGLDSFTLHISYQTENIESTITKWFDNNRDIDSVICGNENICYGVLSAVNRMGIKIPDDLGVISFDDTKWFKFVYTPISAISQPTRKIGEVAVEMLIKRIKNKNIDKNFKDIFLETKLIVRESSVRRA